MEITDIKNTVKKRLSFIEARLFWEDSVSRGDIVNFFDISEPQATNDLSKYNELAPNNSRYNKSLKCYEKTEQFTPILSKQSSEGYLNRLLFMRRTRNDNNFFCGKVPPHAQVPILNTVTDEAIIKKITDGIQNKMAMRIKYQSATRPKPIWRWITPHSIGYNGFRWHTRALCHNHKEYRDFVLPRITSVKKLVEHPFDHNIDYQWNKNIQLIIIANTLLEVGKQHAVELEYGMNKGELKVDLKAAFYFYLERQYGLKDETHCDDTNRLVLKNKQEVEFKVEFLNSMSREKIQENFNFVS